MADSPMSYAIVIGIGIFLAAVLFGARAQRLSRNHSISGSIPHSEAS